MAKTPKERMTDEEIEDWNALYEYVRCNVLGYDKNQSLSRNTVLRLKGLLKNKFMANNNTENTANYSFKVVLNTFKFCMPDIQRGLQANSFVDEDHKTNYVMKIVEKNLNTVYMRMKKAEKLKEEAERYDISEAVNYTSTFRPKENKINNRLNDLW